MSGGNTPTPTKGGGSTPVGPNQNTGSGLNPGNYSNYNPAATTSSTASAVKYPWDDLTNNDQGNVWLGSTEAQVPNEYRSGDIRPGYNHKDLIPQYKSPEEIFKEFWRKAGQDPQGFKELLYDLWAANGGTGRFDALQQGLSDKLDSLLHDAIKNYQKITSDPAYGVPIDFDTFLHQQIAAQGLPDTYGAFMQAGGDDSLNKSGKSHIPPPVHLTDPNSIRQAAVAAAQTFLGRDFTDEEKNKFIDLIHQQETTDQNTVTGDATAPDVGAQAIAFAQNTDPVGFQQHRAQGYANALLQDLGIKEPQFEVTSGV